MPEPMQIDFLSFKKLPSWMPIASINKQPGEFAYGEGMILSCDSPTYHRAELS